MIARRSMLMASLLPTLSWKARAQEQGADPRMALCMHQSTSADAGFRKSLEGWAKAGIQQVELTAVALDEFLRNDSLGGANRLVKDLGLTPVCCTPGLGSFWNPHAGRKELLDVWTRRCEQFATFGIKKVYASTNTTMKIVPDDYKAGPECMREAAEIARQFDMTALVEFTRSSTYVSTLHTLLKLTREAAHPHLKVLFDCYHFHSGLSKMEDLDAVQAGEIGHVHFQDVPDIPRELLGNNTRLVPGDGISPLHAILQKLAQKSYAGSLSVELPARDFRKADPYDLARYIRIQSEAVMRSAGV